MTIAAALLAFGGLPASLAVPAPFPLVVAQAAATAFVAPGIALGRYDVSTSSGPLTITVVAVDLREPTVRVGGVLAHDALISPGETVTSMARRTGAVAGVNADYFDIGQTNQPLGIVVRSGDLLRSPSGRATISVMRDGGLRLGSYRFLGTASTPAESWPVAGVDEWPPQAAAAMLMLPAFGPLPPRPGGAIVSLQPDGPREAGAGGTYQVTAVDPSGAAHPAGLALAIGPAAVASGRLPAVGDTLTVNAELSPSLDGVTTALGGGPLLVRDGRAYADPDPPSPGEALHHDPQVGALRRADGSLVLVSVDGRLPDRSVGLTRPEFGALMTAFGAVDGIGFDSGGSATLVARNPGDAEATVQNQPSDGVERPVADGLFVYSDAPAGAAARLAVRPSPIVLLAGATARVTSIVTDAAGHPLERAPGAPPDLTVEPAGLARAAPGGLVVGLAAGSGEVTARRGGLLERVAVRVVAAPARISVSPARANPDPGGTVAFRAVGFDAAGVPVQLGDAVRWTAAGGSIGADGRFVAGGQDAQVTATVAGRSVTRTVRVGRRELTLPVFGAPVRWEFSTFPAGQPGAVSASAGEDGHGALDLSYDFSGVARAAYASTRVDLAGEPLAVSFDVRGDGNGVALRAAFLNSRSERVLVTVAKRVSWRGWQRCEAALPPSAVPPLRLLSVYAVSGLGGMPYRGSGTIELRDARVVLAGTTLPAPAFTVPDR